VIGGQLPIWVNEGMAEYFGEGVFTGDGFVTGVIPPKRHERIQKQLHANRRAGGFRSIKDMMLLPHSAWNKQLSMANYDQAWSMVQFLAHGENGRYQAAIGAFMRDLGTGLQWQQAWVKNFGSAEGFEAKWKKYWQELPDNPTAELYAKAMTQTITGVLGRATAQKQKFASFDEILAAVEGKSIQIDQRDWLPPRLINSAFGAAKKAREEGYGFEIVPGVGMRPPVIKCTMKDGTKLIGRFVLKSGIVQEVVVDRATAR
jgi:hypothetical protein